MTRGSAPSALSLSTMSLSLALSLSLSLSLATCVDSTGGSPMPLNTKIGAAGGTLKVGSGEVSLTVPPGALSQDVLISVATGQVTPATGFVDVGPVYEFAPTDTAFAALAQLVLPYDQTKISPVVARTEIRVGYRNADGQASQLVPTTAFRGSATLNIAALGTFWVVAPDVVAAAALFPLNDGDAYHYDGGLVLTIDRSTAEPNVAPTETAIAAFALNGTTWGIYFEDSQDQLSSLGEFTAGGQEVFAAPVPLIDKRAAMGAVRSSISAYHGYLPFGSTQVAYDGVAETTTEVAERVRITTPLGAFDTVRVSITTSFVDTRPAQRGERLKLWFASDVGPVAIRLSAGAAQLGLVEATVAGQPVHGQ